jgi:hypothetical protein
MLNTWCFLFVFTLSICFRFELGGCVHTVLETILTNTIVMILIKIFVQRS